MPLIDPVAAEEIQRELTSGESIVWAGRPNTSVIFHREDLFLIPFSLLWGGFAIFWEASVLGLLPLFGKGDSTSLLFGLWGIPFLVIGQYLIWGRFLVAAWLKRRTFYGVTNRRVLTVQNGWGRKTASSYLEAVPAILKEGGRNGIGSLRFSAIDPLSTGRRGNPWMSMTVSGVPMFRDVDEVDAVYQLISECKERQRTTV